MERGLSRILVAASAALLVSCGGGGSGGDPQPDVDGVLLEGQDNALALSAIVDMFPIPADEADIEDDLLLSRLDVAIAADATVGEVNAALEAIDARIVGMRAGFPVLAIAVPRQTGEAALQALADQLMTRTGIRIAVVARQPVAMLAPPSPADAAEALRHLQAAGFPAVWNVKSLAGDCTQRPTVVVADIFVRPLPGNSPYADFGREVPGVDDNGIGGGGTFPNAGYHGYNVLTTLAATLDDEVPTGANPFPGCLDIRTVQVKGLSDEALLTAIAGSIPATGKVVVNASYAYRHDCSSPCVRSSLTTAYALHRGLTGAWARAILHPLADRVLITPAAGNAADDDISAVYRGAGMADYASAFNVAAKADPDMTFAGDESLWEPLRQDCSGAQCVSFQSLTATPEHQARLDAHLADLGLASRTPAANVLVVGSTAPITQQRSAFSNPGHDVAALGEGVPTMDKNADQTFETTQGTSFAAPQVAALAAYLWMISPQLRDGPLADTMSAITGNAAGEADQIDAYASVLSLDPVGEPDPATWNIRVALLDVDGSGAFDQDDLTAFLAAYQAPGAGQDKDYSRHDLNGDGFTGKEFAGARFDLERTGSVRYGAPLLTTERLSIYGAGREIDERFASDKDILCYYAYSALYTGDTEARDTALRDWCAEITVDVTPAEANVSPGDTVSFAADVSGAADPRVTWVLPDGGGSITADGVFTAGDSGGTFTVRAISVEDVNAFGDASVTIANNSHISLVYRFSGVSTFQPVADVGCFASGDNYDFAEGAGRYPLAAQTQETCQYTDATTTSSVLANLTSDTGIAGDSRSAIMTVQSSGTAYGLTECADGNPLCDSLSAYPSGRGDVTIDFEIDGPMNYQFDVAHDIDSNTPYSAFPSRFVLIRLPQGTEVMSWSSHTDSTTERTGNLVAGRYRFFFEYVDGFVAEAGDGTLTATWSTNLSLELH